MSSATAVAEKGPAARDASVRERPILMSAPMVRAVLDGTKTQTRRVVLPQPVKRGRGPDNAPVGEISLRPDELPTGPENGWLFCEQVSRGQRRYMGAETFVRENCPFGQPGDRLWVRETFSLNHSIHYAHHNNRGTTGMLYRASWERNADVYGRPFEGERRWRPSIHMPRWASRITLELTGVRVERVQDISEADAIAEGVEPVVTMGTHRTFVNYAPGLPAHLLARDSYRTLWDSLNEKRGYGWDANPWVWVLEFRRLAA
jgi:hypothetical protein